MTWLINIIALPSQSKNSLNILAVRSGPIQSRRLFPLVKLIHQGDKLILAFAPADFVDANGRDTIDIAMCAPQLTVIPTNLKTVSHLILKTFATSFQLNRLHQVARNQA
nr:hypothetical protein [uncultured Desulfobulbus sp.]